MCVHRQRSTIRTSIQTCLTKEAEEDASTQTRNQHPNVFETVLETDACMQTRNTFQKCLSHRVETMLVNNKDHSPNVFGQRAVD